MNQLIKSSGGMNLIPLESTLMDKRRIFIEGTINQEKAMEFFKQVITLNELDPHAPIDVYINSHGGEVTAGLSIHTTMKLSTAPIRTFCLSECYSMAAVIFSGGTGGRYMYKTAKVMVHEPLLGNAVSGNLSSMKSIYESMAGVKDQLNAIIASNTGHTPEEIDKTSEYDHYFTAEEALSFGFCDEIIDNFNTFMGGNV